MTKKIEVILSLVNKGEDSPVVLNSCISQLKKDGRLYIDEDGCIYCSIFNPLTRSVEFEWDNLSDREVLEVFRLQYGRSWVNDRLADKEAKRPQREANQPLPRFVREEDKHYKRWRRVISRNAFGSSRVTFRGEKVCGIRIAEKAERPYGGRRPGAR